MSDVMSGNTIDSRDVIKRIEELKAEREAVTDGMRGKKKQAAALAEWDESEEGEELRDLKAFAEEAEGYASDWSHGETIIADHYFQDYAEQLAENIGAVDRGAGWPKNCIDWEEAANQLKQDYTEIEYRGNSYWIR